MQVAKKEIYSDVNKATLKWPELKQVFYTTKFPIAFIIVGTVKTFVRLFMGFSLNPWFQLMKFSIYYMWLRHSMNVNTANFKLQKRVKLFKELQEEVIKMTNIIQKAEKDGALGFQNRKGLERWWPFDTANYGF